MASYQYQRVGSKTEFRLLELLPGTGDSQIQCRLKQAFIRDGQKYFAVSYRWGIEESRNEIICEGKTLIVSRNCATLLFWLRDRKYRYLWIDAICIDQNRNDLAVAELQDQLKLMTEIYKNSVRVVAFLGSGTRDTQFIMLYLRFCGRLMWHAPFSERNPRMLSRLLLNKGCEYLPPPD